MSSAGYAAILARLQVPQLRTHCEEALRLELVQVQHQMYDMRAAMRRLRDVGKAATALRNGEGLSTESHAALIQSNAKIQRDLARAVNQFGLVAVLKPAVRSESFVCCKCKVEVAPIQPTLLSKPDAAALSPPRRAKPEKPELKKLQTNKRRKLTTASRPSSAQPMPTSTAKSEPVILVQPLPVKLQAKEEVKENDYDDENDDIRTRLNRRVDACWPLATSLGALEMKQRRVADYAELVDRVCALFHVLYLCDTDAMASRNMRSVIVKAKDSLAVAVSLLHLHEVVTGTGPKILALVNAVDAASTKHATSLQRHIAPFRDSLAELEVVFLTSGFMPNAASPTRQKLRTGRQDKANV